ncbi:RuvX/YqgF family protein [Candidatus Absconditicoccus praedator]|uniref:RuvX/YqgF family protein n=1 Tax=Candidatus Absconditicoccus praedator TaxID=2735562 RepID=UPI001E55A383|nr:RuvX/YqgF family protein [Candidatus Absconditicoccus praedator]UFX83048.1 Holliday junction resolvase RuvX [Candidatus Absconditicoccus praedator]
MSDFKNLLAVDWGKKYVGLAYQNVGTEVIFPIGFLQNDPSLFFNFGDIISRYNIGTILVGYPKNQEDIKKKIDDFISQIEFIINDDVKIKKVNEDYSSVQAKYTVGEYKKNETTDTVAAMKILQNYLNEER